MKFTGLILVLWLCSFKTDHALAPDKTEATAAFALINAMRANPAAYSAQLGVNLNSVKPMPALTWNDTLARVAEIKVLDMAKRNYFNHINPDGYGMNFYINKAGYTLPARWLDNIQNNYFESIQAGAGSGEDAVKFLIIDKDIPALGHRKHLLGIGDWDASLYDIGIGFVRNKEGAYYKSYTCVLIAKHR